MSDQTPSKPREFTGKHMLIVTVSAFAVIIAANLTLAFSAVGTFPGLETKSAYVESQNFDEDRAKQLALGWDVAAEVIEKETLRLTILDQSGAPVEPQIINAIFGRATNVTQDQTPDFQWTGTAFEAPVRTAPGNWNLRLRLRAENGTLFRQRIVIYLGS